MAAYAPIASPVPGFSYPPPENPYGGNSHAIAALPHLDMSGMQSPALHYPGHQPYPSNLAYAHLTGHSPSSPMISNVQMPPSPVTHSSVNSPSNRESKHDRRSSGSAPINSADAKMMRQMMATMAQMQTTMKEMAQRQEQMLDRMSLLEQRVGRIDDNVNRIVEVTEVALEDSRSIRERVEDNENLDAFETRLADLMDGVVQRLVNGIGSELKDIKKSVKDAEKLMRVDPFVYEDKRLMAQRIHDAAMINEEAQREVVKLEVSARC